MTRVGDLYELDDTDRAILAALRDNARKSYREISREVGVALATVSHRIGKLEDAGVIQGYVPLIDHERLGADLSVIIGLRIAHGKMMEVQRAIAKDEHVVAIYDVTGNFDSILVVRFHNRAELDAFIKELQSMEHVENTTTHLVLNTVKEQHHG